MPRDARTAEKFSRLRARLAEIVRDELTDRWSDPVAVGCYRALESDIRLHFGQDCHTTVTDLEDHMLKVLLNGISWPIGDVRRAVVRQFMRDISLVLLQPSPAPVFEVVR
jgi:hypothetical protein